MKPPADTAANEFVQFYGREAWTDWQRLLAHFDLGEGFAFLVLLLPGAVGAEICRRQLAEHLRAKGKHLLELGCQELEDARRLPERLFAVQPTRDLGGLWLGAVIPESDPEIKQWQQAWRYGLASLNEQRNPLRERFACPLVLVGAPWLHTLLREAAPDLWSVRTGVVSVAPSLERGPAAAGEPGLVETEPARLLAGEAASDPDYALEQAERLRDKPGLEPVRAQLLLRAGNGFYNHARLDAAERCFRVAADLFRASAANNPDLQAPWAAALNSLANTLSELGRREEALDKAQEAVRIREQLAKAKPDAFLPGLAMSLNVLAISLSELGRRDEALGKAQEAARIYEQLAKAGPDASLPDLAMSLNNLAIRLSALGRREEALDKAQEAMRIYQQLAKTRPDAFLPYFAGSLNNLANCLIELGRRGEALAKAQEATGLYERLAHARPDAFLPYFAGSLNNLANTLGQLGRREEALAKAEEAVLIHGQLARARPDAFLPDLAGSLNNLANNLGELGRQDEALAKAQEAARICEQLAKARPDASLPDLAMSLNNLAIRLSELGRREEALAKAQEATRIYEQLARARPDAFGAKLATSTSVLRGCLHAVGKHEPAAEAARKALAQLKPHFLALPHAHAGLMGVLLSDYKESVERAHTKPDMALLAPVSEILEQLSQNPKKG